MTGKKKSDYEKPQSYPVIDDTLDDITGGAAVPETVCSLGEAVSGGSCSIGASGRGECGAGLVTSFCTEGGCAGENCLSGRIR